MCESDKTIMKWVRKGDFYYQDYNLSQYQIKEVIKLLEAINKIEPIAVKKKWARWDGTDPIKVDKAFRFLLVIIADKHRLSPEIIQSKKKCKATTLARADFARIAFNKIVKNKQLIAKYLGRGGGNTSMTTAFEYWTDKPVTRLTKEIGALFDGNNIN